MTRSKFSTKAVLLAGAIGLSTAVFAGAQPAAAQSYTDENSCPAGFVSDATSGCTLPGATPTRPIRREFGGARRRPPEPTGDDGARPWDSSLAGRGVIPGRRSRDKTRPHRLRPDEGGHGISLSG